MRRSVFTAGALALIATSANAFAPSAAPSIALRKAGATAPLARKSGHFAGCACGACGGLSKRRGFSTRRKQDTSLSMAAVDPAHARIMEEASNLAADSETYCKNLDQLFPGAVSEEKFIEQMSKVVMEVGFNPKTAINLVSTCRDEICRPFTEKLDSLWGESFSIASLGGFVFCGKTGFGAGMAHSPQVDGKERYIFWIGPHIAYGTDGPVGKIWRPGRDTISSACGALIALNGEIDAAKLAVGLDPADTEMSLLRQSVLGKLTYGQQPNLVGITYAAHDCILDQVRATAKVAAPQTSEYIIISGIQIHGALNENFWWPGSITHYADGKETDLSPKYEASISGYSLGNWLQAEAVAQLQASPKTSARLPGFFADVV